MRRPNPLAAWRRWRFQRLLASVHGSPVFRYVRMPNKHIGIVTKVTRLHPPLKGQRHEEKIEIRVIFIAERWRLPGQREATFQPNELQLID
jgi:hypothetical protein